MTNQERLDSIQAKLAEIEALVSQMSKSDRNVKKVNAVKFDLSALKQGLQQLQEVEEKEQA